MNRREQRRQLQRWMIRQEFRELPQQAAGPIEEIAIRLIGECGLRVGEVLDVNSADISRYPDCRHYNLEITSGKDTTREYEDGKQRETWLSVDLEARINQVVQNDISEIGRHDPIVYYAKRTVQGWVERAADAAADDTGNDDYRRVSTHDLRRCWANHLGVEESVSPRILMALDGWKQLRCNRAVSDRSHRVEYCKPTRRCRPLIAPMDSAKT